METAAEDGQGAADMSGLGVAVDPALVTDGDGEATAGLGQGAAAAVEGAGECAADGGNGAASAGGGGSVAAGSGQGAAVTGGSAAGVAGDSGQGTAGSASAARLGWHSNSDESWKVCLCLVVISQVAISFLVLLAVLCSWRTPSSQMPKYSNAGIRNTDNTCSWCCSCHVGWTCTHVCDSKVTFVLLMACMYGLGLCM